MKNCVAVIQILACFIVMVGIAEGSSHSHQTASMVVVAAAKRTPKLTPTPTPSPAPAPAPAPAFTNLKDLLSLAGPFKTLLSFLEASNLLTTLQTQANNTEQGITIFAPSDAAFSYLPKKLLTNLTVDQKKEVLLAHCIPKFYTLSDFQNFSNPANTMATGSNGGKYNLNITAKNGAVTVSSGYVSAAITGTVRVTDPVAVYTMGKVLLPEDIFGLPSPSPAPASEAADNLSPEGTHASSPSSAHASSAASFLSAQQFIDVILALAMATGALLLL